MLGGTVSDCFGVDKNVASKLNPKGFLRVFKLFET